jgi:hypothetical protein
MVTFLSIITAVITAIFKGKQALILENLALRQQLASYKRTSKRSLLRQSERVFWV